MACALGITGGIVLGGATGLMLGGTVGALAGCACERVMGSAWEDADAEGALWGAVFAGGFGMGKGAEWAYYDGVCGPINNDKSETRS